MKRLVFLIAACISASAHTSLFTSAGAAYTRSDYSNVIVSFNDDFRSGALNSNGRPMLTFGSNAPAALQAAANAWSRVDGSRIRFAGLASTTLVNDTKDLQNVMLLRDTPEVRSIVGDAAAVTLLSTLPTTGEIIDADILFSPSLVDRGIPFSTTGASGTIDLQATAAHELGHLLGAGHSHVMAASMFPSGGSPVRRTLSSDDTAYARSAAPIPGTEGLDGILRGVISLPSGQPARRVAVTATDSATGITVGALTDVSGAYSMPRLPKGRYVVFAEPLDGPAFPVNFNVAQQDADLGVEATFFDGKRAVDVMAGSTVEASFAMPQRAGTVDITFIAQGSTGGSGDFSSNTFPSANGSTSFDLLIAGPGIDSPALDIEILGAAATIRPGSVHVDPRLLFPDGSKVIRFTVDLDDTLNRSVASLIVRRGNGMSTATGGLVIEPTVGALLGLTTNSIVNAATASPGAVAPNSWVSIFAKNLALQFVLGPDTLPTQIDGTSVIVTDSQGVGRSGRLQFVSPEQINFLMPSGVASGTARITVTSFLGQGSTNIQVAGVAPGIFAANSDGRGPAAATYLRVLAGGAQQSGFTFGTDKTPRENVPVDLSDSLYLIFYGTGIRGRAGPVTATVGGMSVPVLAAVPQGQYAGLDQINIGPLPAALVGRGEVGVSFQMDQRTTNAVTVTIR